MYNNNTNNNNNRNSKKDVIIPIDDDNNKEPIILPSVASGFKDDDEENAILIVSSSEPLSDKNKKNNNKDNEKIKFWKQPFIRDKMGMMIFVSISLINNISSGLLLPNLFTQYVKTHNPDYTPAQMESEASKLKSISDSLPYVANFLFSPILGIISDRFGRKIVLFIIMILQIIDMGTIGFCYWKTMLIPVYISHMIAGVINGVLPVVFSYYADLTTKQDRGHWFMMVGVGLGFSIVVGPLILMALLKKSFYAAVYGCIAITTVSIFTLIPLVNSIKFMEGRPKTEAELMLKSSNSINPFRSIKRLFTSSKYVICYAILYVSFSFTLQDVITTSYYYTELRYGWGASQNSITSCLLGVSILIWSGLLIPLLLKVISDRKLVSICFFASGVFHILYAFAYNQWMWAVFATVGSFTLVIINLIQSIISKSTPPEIMGVVLAGISSISSLSGAAGSFAAQNIFAYFISSRAPIHFDGMHFIINAGIIFITFIFSLFILKVFPNPDKQNLQEKKPLLLADDPEEDDHRIN